MSVVIILASHGEFAKGVKHTGDMIVGEQDLVEVCLLMPEDSPEAFGKRVEALMTKYQEPHELLFLVDLQGGTPFNQINQIREQTTQIVEIVTGLNIPMVIQAYGDRFNSALTATDIAVAITKEGLAGITTSAKAAVASQKRQQRGDMAMNDKKMSELGIQHIRLDERLIHGQVATLWLGKIGASRVMIVDDDIVADQVAKASLKAAVPGGIKLSILKTETAAKRLIQGVYKGQKVMILAKSIQTIFDLISAGVPIQTFNLGNSSLKEGTKQISKSVFLTEAEIMKILELEKQGVAVTAQMVPMEEAKRFSQFYRE